MSSLNGRIERLEKTIPEQPEPEPATPTEQQNEYWRTAIADVQRCVNEDLVFTYETQRGLDNFMPEIGCYKCTDHRHWESVIHMIQHLAELEDWKTAEVPTRGEPVSPHEPHSIEELKEWLPVVWDIQVYIEGMYDKNGQLIP